MLLFTLVPLLLFLAFAPDAQAAKAECTAGQMRQIREMATPEKPAVLVECSFRLNHTDVITKELRFIGEASSDVEVLCNKARIVAGTLPRSFKNPIVHFKSKKIGKTRWQPVHNVRMKDCRIEGNVRLTGMAINGEGVDLRQSSRKAGHIERAQAAAPRHITLDHVTITSAGSIAVYIAPGVTRFSLLNSHVNGRSNSVGIYLDAESAENRILNSSFSIDSKRETIAIDGSARNEIRGNRFNTLKRGGIYVYRNCGEGGTIRHQMPQGNVLSENYFYYNKFKGFGPTWLALASNKSLRVPAIWLGSRAGYRPYCEHDKGFPFGSSVSNEDFASHNIVKDNRIRKLPVSRMIRAEDSPNRIVGNVTVND